MRALLLSIGVGYVALQGVYAVTPWVKLFEDFKLTETTYDPLITAMDAHMTQVAFGLVVGDANHNMTPGKYPGEWAWPSDPSFDDSGTGKWYPQGLSSSADADQGGRYGIFKTMLVSWYWHPKTEPNRGVRLAFIDMDATPWTYRHVLLVVPSGTSDQPSYDALAHIHAGGIMWYGNLLYVVDTHGGLRVFDMDHLYAVDDSKRSENRIGRQTNGSYYAYGYKYVLPQCRTYLSNGRPTGSPFNFSYIALDRTTTPNTFVVGEYNTTKTARMARYALNADTHRPTTDANSEATATEAFYFGYNHIQGMCSLYGKYYMTRSNGSHPGAQLIYNGATLGQFNNTWDPSPEDLTWDDTTGRLWTLTERPKGRYIEFVNPLATTTNTKRAAYRG